MTLRAGGGVCCLPPTPPGYRPAGSRAVISRSGLPLLNLIETLMSHATAKLKFTTFFNREGIVNARCREAFRPPISRVSAFH